jgi:hypothetical protein
MYDAPHCCTLPHCTTHHNTTLCHTASCHVHYTTLQQSTAPWAVVVLTSCRAEPDKWPPRPCPMGCLTLCIQQMARAKQWHHLHHIAHSTLNTVSTTCNICKAVGAAQQHKMVSLLWGQGVAWLLSSSRAASGVLCLSEWFHYFRFPESQKKGRKKGREDRRHNCWVRTFFQCASPPVIWRGIYNGGACSYVT